MVPSALLQKNFPFPPTLGQLQVFSLLDDFILKNDEIKKLFLLKGYAGTGKTTLISELVKIVHHFGYDYLLMAPTGRAAKVMASYSKRKANTIHKVIYTQAKSESTALSFRLRKNMNKNTIFIVDESSMINDEREGGMNGLLEDLLTFVYEKSGNKLLLIGDSAQLPPIKQEISPALNGEYLKIKYDLSVTDFELTEVLRQEKESGILANATALRENIRLDRVLVEFKTKGYKDIYNITGEKLEDGLRYSYNKFGKENTVLICRSNKAATQYNQFIRRNINFSEEEINAGDILMVVRNNYTVLPEDSPSGFLANGDFVEIKRVIDFEEAHGFRFATLELTLLDSPEEPAFRAKVILDTLHSFSPSMTYEDNKKLYESVYESYSAIVSKKAKMDAIKADEYMNALQVKFAYALTCHKSQGGQWNSVFIDQGYLTDEMINKEYLRWLYTAITRASSEIYLLNFQSKKFSQ